MLETIKKNLNAKRNYIDYIHVCTIFLVCNDKNTSETKNTQSSMQLLLNHIGNILSAIGTPTYKLAKFCDKLLKPITNNKYTTKDSFSFAKEV